MTHDVKQWLGEIKNLQQKLVEAHRERDEAYASAANWRSLYETEAKQRRTEANLSKQAIEELSLKIQQLESSQEFAPLEGNLPEALQEHIHKLESVEALQQELAHALMECDRLTNALKAEQRQHEQTRRGLTSALGDTMDLLTQERSHRGNSSSNGGAVGAIASRESTLE
ncbi:hypothetical protein ACQ4M4_02715 [Leptolyngbya sp. AN02str]|uniref:hypothetical protein n=1 Tax=Leptolyngbya sp. AN02str TaxID=3423363 RepID=UPI003D3112A8